MAKNKYITNEIERFEISQGAILIRNNKVLIGETAFRPGQWDIPGGRIDVKEVGEVAFKREIKEELGLDAFEFVDVVDYEVFYTTKTKKPICAIANLIKNDNDEIKMSDEHLCFKWITEQEIDDYEFVWPNARRMLKKGFKKYKELQK